MDVIKTFLNGVLKEEIYIIQFKGLMVSDHKKNICHLLKSLYRLE